METLDAEVQQPRPRTWIVLTMLVAAAVTLSWLGSYALTNVLIAVDMASPWSPGHDPRPARFVLEFLSLISGFVASYIFIKLYSAWQMKRIEEDEDAPDDSPA